LHNMDTVDPFSVDRGVVLKTLLFSPSCGWPVWATLSIGLLLIGVGCLYDVRYLVLGLMICVAVIPGIVAFIYFSHTLAREMVPNLLPHTLERCEDGFLIRIWCRRESEGESDEDPKDKPEVESPGEVCWKQSGLISLFDQKIVDRKTTAGYDVFYFKDSPMKILYVPRY
ncbi:MAG: hypothetical protein K2M16_03665, partial [Muribaculaceae bacterium]|nr:hypothetical protein [Muribaculaceae bacterium]